MRFNEISPKMSKKLGEKNPVQFHEAIHKANFGKEIVNILFQDNSSWTESWNESITILLLVLFEASLIKFFVTFLFHV